MTVLIDTSIFLSLVFSKDLNHLRTRQALQALHEERIIAASVLPELFYMAAARMNYTEALRTFRLIRTSAFRIADLTNADMNRMDEIMVTYHDNSFDFVDVSLMALSERLNIDTIYTLDQRDFTVFRPKHCAYLKLLP